MKGKRNLIKLVAVLCAVFVFVTGFAGCGSKDTSSSETNATTVSNDTTTSAEEPKQTNPFENHLKYTMSVIDADKAGKDKDGKIAANFDWFCKKFNIEIEFVPLTWGDYIDKTRLWLASGDAPDLMMLDIAPTRYPEFLNWARQGMFKAYPDLDKYTNLKQKMDVMATGKKFIVDEKLYAWPAYLDLDKYGYRQNNMPEYRRDWARQVGLLKDNDEYTWEEWTALIKAVVEKDPAGNKKTIGLAGNDWCFPKFFGPGNLSPNMLAYTKGTDGKWTWGPMLPESLEAVKLTRKMYDEGLIYKDQIMAKNDEIGPKFQSGLVFANIGGNGSVGSMKADGEALQKAVSGFDPAKDLGFAFVHGPDGKIMSSQMNDQWSQEAMNADLDDERAERWTTALDWLVSEEGYYFRNAGIPQQDWTLDGGTLKVNWKEWPHGDGSWAWLRAAGCNDGYALIDAANPQYARDAAVKGYERMQKEDVNLIKLNVDLNYFSAPNYDKTGNKEREIYQEIAKLMVSKNLEKDWNEWAKSKEAEINPVLAELNEKLK
jgi:putative aldouronate transport system substrate-binding protein